MSAERRGSIRTSCRHEASIQEIYGALAVDEDRLQLVVADARDLLEHGRAVMVLTERRDHLDRLAESLLEDVPNVVVLHGGIQVKARRAALKRLAGLSDHEPRLVLATGRYIGEGFDDPRLDTLLLTMPIAWKGTVVQYAGRLHRSLQPSATHIRLRRRRCACAAAYVRQAPPRISEDGLLN